MFTGIITHIGTLRSRQRHGGDESLVFDAAPDWLGNAAIGDSISVNGVCLTVTDTDKAGFFTDVSGETLSCTTLGDIETGAGVNLEKALRPTDALGGHLVSGHIDAVAEVLGRHVEARSERILFSLPPELAPLVAAKGSICVDGISLTVNEVELGQFGVNIVPYTLEATVAGSYQTGTRVNLEVDIIARYVARILGAGNGPATE